MKQVRNSIVAAAGVIVLAVAGPVSAEESVSAPRSEQTEKRLDDLERRIDSFQKSIPSWNGSAAREIAKDDTRPLATGNGYGTVAVNSPDGNAKFKFGGFIQGVNRTFLDPPTERDTFLVRRLVTTFDVNLLKNIDFRTQWDFGLGKVASNDNYLNVRFSDSVQLRAGKFKVPFGLETLASSQELLFVERALPSNLAPNRDIGFEIVGEIHDSALVYAVGVFNGVPDGATGDGDTDNNKEFAGRVFARPFKSSGIKPLEGLGFGVAGTYGDQTGSAKASNLPSLKTPGQGKLFEYTTSSTPTAANTVVADGTHYRFSPQGYYYWGPFGLLGEYVLSTQDVRLGSSRATLSNDAWQLQVSYVLTGEKASPKGVTPSRPFVPGAASTGSGAIQLVARYSELNIDKKAFPTFASINSSPRSIKAYAAGADWYLNKNLKFQANYEQSKFHGGAANGDRPDEKVFATNVQVAF